MYGLPRLSEQGHFVPEGEDLLGAGVLDIEGLDGHGAVPVAPVDRPERALADRLLVEEDVLGRHLPVLLHDSKHR